MTVERTKNRCRLFVAVAVAVSILTGGRLEAATVSADTIKEAVRTYIEKHMPWPKGNIRVFFTSQFRDLQLPGKKIDLEVRGKRNDNFVGDSFYTVSFYEDDVLLRQETVRAKIEVFRDVALSVRALEKGREIRSEDVRFEGRWFTDVPANAVTDFSDFVGKQLTTSVRPNCEITRNMLRSYPLVRRGKVVRVVLESGRMTIMTVGLPEEDGSRNDVVRVKNLSSNKVIYARVVEDNTVRVDF